MAVEHTQWPQALTGLDWRKPWLAPYATNGAPLAQAVLQGTAVWQALNAQLDAQPDGASTSRSSFVAQSELAHGQAYEAHIYQTATVPTRCGAHDFFNGLMWLNWPHTKTALNQRQWQAIDAAGGVGQTRGPTRDALTLLDENGGILLAPTEVWDALRHRNWHKALVQLRPLWAQCQLFIIGHALLEQLLLHPRKSLTAHLWMPTPSVQALVGQGAGLAQLDVALAQALGADDLSQKPFTPLPVMGAPGWCADNANAAFYDDAQVFRALRAEQNPPQRVATLTSA